MAEWADNHAEHDLHTYSEMIEPLKTHFEEHRLSLHPYL